MTPIRTAMIALALLVSLAVLAVWLTTGADAYTKFTVVEQRDRVIDPDDPLAATGFYDDEEQAGANLETVTRDEFRLGLLPTPQGLFDKHALSVASLLGPVWAAALLGLWITRKQTSTTQKQPTTP